MVIGILSTGFGHARVFRPLTPRINGLSTLALLFTNNLEECDRNKTTRGRNERIAGFVPLGIVFTTQYVKEVAFMESQLLTIFILRLVIVEGLDDLFRRNDCDGAFRTKAEVWRLALPFVALEGPTDSLARRFGQWSEDSGVAGVSDRLCEGAVARMPSAV